ncbi:hypothetical protein [Thalassolituus sp.]|jgi:hypothetical protein|uniref:hypothetical protein n=1 Tax=Thalassolituus sp. TaxID=2030822 RepID=UPI0032D90654
MGREVRYVPAGWQHPQCDGVYTPLNRLDMPACVGGNAHLQMYETDSKGTPVSPVMDKPETLAHWLVDNHVSAYGRQITSYEAWLLVCQGKAIIPNYTRTEIITNQVQTQDPFKVAERKKHNRKQEIER